MASTGSAGRSVIVTGDMTTDWNLVTVDQGGAETESAASAAWSSDDSTRAVQQPGGTALLGELIAEVARPLDATVRHAGELLKENADPGFRHSYAVWSQFVQALGSEDAAPRTWRVDRFLGLDRRDQQKGLEALTKWNRSIADLAPGLVILDDGNLGFRENRKLWPKVLLGDVSEPRPWVLLKMARPIAQGPLFEHLRATCPDRAVVVTRIRDLRQSEVRISRELSWELTAEDLYWELTNNTQVNALADCAHVIVSIETGGALLLSSAGAEETPQATLVYDPRFIEGEWARNHPGKMIGSTSCMTAGVVRELLFKPGKPNLAKGIERGLTAMRALQENGWRLDPDAADDVAFPLQPIAKVIGGRGRTRLARQSVPAADALQQPHSVDELRRWTILGEHCPLDRVEREARKIAVKGVKAVLPGVPIGQFGKLTTVDRQEIEGLRSISSLIQEYSDQRGTSPLSIAVFGPPGSGKSFAVKQVAKTLLRGQVEELPFNLSEFNEPSALYGAFHQVRDKCLEGKLPLVFWDEFDAAELRWLRHFLVPMQDGTFQEGEITHPIGRAIFVFAGGVYESVDQFRSPQTKEQKSAFKVAKGPDFVSRLKGYVDIVGPDPRKRNRELDPYFRVRRAVLLGSILKGIRPQLVDAKTDEVQIDAGVLRAFLETATYRHGVRSLEAIIAMSTLAGKSRFERSSLPSEPQLDLHVDAKDFLGRVQGLTVLEEPPKEDVLPERERDLFERLAEGVHIAYCERVLADGFVWADPSDDYLSHHELLQRFVAKMDDRRRAGAKPKRALVPYEDLAEDLKQSNRHFARDIVSKLDHVDCIMRPARPGDPAFAFTDEDVEALAEYEHERWMREKLRLGWRWCPEDDDENRESSSLLPWSTLSDKERQTRYGDYAECVGVEELSEGVKEWDRQLVRGIPKIVAIAGYTVERHSGLETLP